MFAASSKFAAVPPQNKVRMNQPAQQVKPVAMQQQMNVARSVSKPQAASRSSSVTTYNSQVPSVSRTSSGTCSPLSSQRSPLASVSTRLGASPPGSIRSSLGSTVSRSSFGSHRSSSPTFQAVVRYGSNGTTMSSPTATPTTSVSSFKPTSPSSPFRSPSSYTSPQSQSRTLLPASTGNLKHFGTMPEGYRSQGPPSSNSLDGSMSRMSSAGQAQRSIDDTLPQTAIIQVAGPPQIVSTPQSQDKLTMEVETQPNEHSVMQQDPGMVTNGMDSIEGPIVDVAKSEQSEKEHYMKNVNIETFQPSMLNSTHMNPTFNADHSQNHYAHQHSHPLKVVATNFASHQDNIKQPFSQEDLQASRKVVQTQDVLDCQAHKFLMENVDLNFAEPDEALYDQKPNQTANQAATCTMNPTDADECAPATPKTSALLKLQEELARLQQEVETMKAKAEMTGGAAWRDGVATGFAPGVGVGAIVGASCMLLL